MIQSPTTSLALTPHIKRLPNGRFQGYIEYRAPGCTATAPESYIAGDFDDDRHARLAALRLLRAFRSTVVAPEPQDAATTSECAGVAGSRSPSPASQTWR